MFTGIIQAVGHIDSMTAMGNNVALAIEAARKAELARIEREKFVQDSTLLAKQKLPIEKARQMNVSKNLNKSTVPFSTH